MSIDGWRGGDGGRTPCIDVGTVKNIGLHIMCTLEISKLFIGYQFISIDGAYRISIKLSK